MSPCMILKILEVWETMLEVGMVVGGEEAGWHAPYPGGNREGTIVCQQFVIRAVLGI